MIHDLWSLGYVVKRFGDKAEEHGMEAVEASGYETSTKRLCGPEGTLKREGSSRPQLRSRGSWDEVGVLNRARSGSPPCGGR
ncbi:TPA: hypothetical protein EYP44_05910 [Candidatus Bathyarchaeota archaeon]|nr:hypothetical protein [Candidatus Bathyarchaeota archaeon]